MAPVKRNKWNQESMAAAIADVKARKLSIHKASQHYNVPKSTLHDRISGRVKEDTVNGKPPILSSADEKQLIKIATERAEMGVGFNKSNFKRAAAALAKQRGASFKKGVPSEKWWTLFKKRNGGEVSLRQPESTASIRHKTMTKERTNKYFTVLSEVLTTYGLDGQPNKIWNMDESFISLSSDSSLVVTRTGTKYIQSKTGSREHVTILACGSAAGKFIPPHFIMKGKTQVALRSWDSENAPIGSFVSVSDSGWIKQGLSLLWFQKVFLPNIGPERPQILIFDGHDSHHHVELIECARENNIVLMEIPAHCFHWLQPLDRHDLLSSL
ncbi:uncharacterized protein LOC134249051 [Saccostrea cucullata]|uniref:uncharacterized protein LOC134249051 n=1 Tax=Saccostrea cuccullata TaxID=36930 RepID=UPI002ED09C2A